MAVATERTLTPAEVRTQIMFDEAVLAEASRIMHYTKEQLETLDAGAARTRLEQAWQQRGQADGFEAFAAETLRRLTNDWHAASEHAGWFEDTFEPELLLSEAVSSEAWDIMFTPLDELRFTDVDDNLRRGWQIAASSDTFVAFTDKVHRRLVKLWGPDDAHAAWFASKYPSRG